MESDPAESSDPLARPASIRKVCISSNIPIPSPSDPAERLSCTRVLAYGIGHAYNDMCASMWFSYLVLYFNMVRSMPPELAGALLLIGQIADALCTPFMGYESDRSNWIRCCVLYGKRKSWHLLGTLAVTFSFMFIFMRCPQCSSSARGDLVQFFYYIPFIVLFQFGWATVQISHLALVPELTSDEHQRTTLNSVRNAFTVFGSIAMFVVATGLLSNFDFSHDSSHGAQELSVADEDTFKFLAIGVTVVGCACSLLFHLGIREPSRRRTLSRIPSNEHFIRTMRWKDWFRERQFYQVAIIYLSTRVYINVFATVLGYYIQFFARLPKLYMGISPLVVFASGFGMSALFSLQAVGKIFSKKNWFLIGALVGCTACAGFYSDKLHYWVYLLLIAAGAAQTVVLVTSLGFVADLIRKNTESGAFVYGVMSFFDKLACGLAIFILAHLTPPEPGPGECEMMPLTDECTHYGFYWRDATVFVPKVALLVSAVTVLTLLTVNLGERAKREEKLEEEGVRDQNPDA